MMQVIGLLLRTWERSLPEFLFALGFGLLLGGVFLQLRMGHDIMRAEESMKDGRLTEEQANRRIAVARIAGPLAILLGAASFAVVFLR